jgi:zinc transporter 5/7
MIGILFIIIFYSGLLFFHEHAHYVPNNKNSHQHSNCNHSHNHNHNLEGIFLILYLTLAVFLHILADALGSVGVLISTLLIIYYDL